MVAGLVLFVWHSVTSERHTLFSLKIFADRNFAAASFVGAAKGLSLYGGMLLQPLFFEGLLQFPSFDTGIAMVPRGIGSLASMLMVGRLLGRFGAKPLIFFGIGASLAGAWMMTGLSLDASGRTTLVPLLLQGFGVGFVFIPLSAVAFATLPRALATEAAGVYNLIRSLGSSIGISIVSVYMTRSAQASWSSLRQYLDPYRPEVKQYLDPLHLKAQGAGLALLAQQVAQQAQMMGLLKAFWLIVASFVAMIPLVLLLRPVKSPAAEVPAMAE
jgi:DHA2 family multidrug resistance protein